MPDQAHRLVLQRIDSEKESTLGWTALDGKFLHFTLEDEGRNIKVYGETRIPAGVYPLKFTHSPKFSPRFGHDMIEIDEIPGFDLVYFHPGNFTRETDGCILVGYGIVADPRDGEARIVGGTSFKAYMDFYKLIAPLMRVGSLTHVEVVDPPA